MLLTTHLFSKAIILSIDKLVLGYGTTDAKSWDPEKLSESLITGRIPEAWTAG